VSDPDPRTTERLALLIHGSASFKGNYTEATYVARWTLERAEVIGWGITITEQVTLADLERYSGVK
jgi:hypothetical protein